MQARGLSRGAGDHVNDVGAIGATGHYGSDGSTPLDRISRYGTVPANNIAGENISYSSLNNARWHVMQLVIDDGVPNRGHRQVLLQPAYRLTGVTCGTHVVFESMCNITYASDYAEHE